jgi:hypothetical protein
MIGLIIIWNNQLLVVFFRQLMCKTDRYVIYFNTNCSLYFLTAASGRSQQYSCMSLQHYGVLHSDVYWPGLREILMPKCWVVCCSGLSYTKTSRTQTWEMKILRRWRLTCYIHINLYQFGCKQVYELRTQRVSGGYGVVSNIWTR